VRPWHRRGLEGGFLKVSSVACQLCHQCRMARAQIADLACLGASKSCPLTISARCEHAAAHSRANPIEPCTLRAAGFTHRDQNMPRPAPSFISVKHQ